MTVILALQGAGVWALDVSEVFIERQRLMARENGVGNFDIPSRLSKPLSRGPLESAPRPIAWIILGLARLDRILLVLPFTQCLAGHSVVVNAPETESVTHISGFGFLQRSTLRE